MSAAAAPQQFQSSSTNTPGFFASAFMEMNIFEQCFSAAAADPKTSSQDSTTAPRTSLLQPGGVPPSASDPPPSLPPIPPLSPRTSTTSMRSYAPSEFTLPPNLFDRHLPDAPAPNPSLLSDEIDGRYAQSRWPSTNSMEATVPPSVIQQQQHAIPPPPPPPLPLRLSPPYSPGARSPPEQFLPPADLESDLSPLHSMLVNYPTEARSAHGQITPPEDSNSLSPIHPGEVAGGGGRSKPDDDDDANGDDDDDMARALRNTRQLRPRPSRSGNRRTKRPSSGAAAGTLLSSSSSPSSSSPSSVADNDPTKEAKRQKFLERNRIAASKCRRKKKQWTQNLEENARRAQQNSRNLNKMVSNLRDELLTLKGELLKHNGCECERIKQYLMNEATRVVQGTTNNSGSSNNMRHHRQQSQISDIAFGSAFDDMSDSSGHYPLDINSPASTSGMNQ